MSPYFSKAQGLAFAVFLVDLYRWKSCDPAGVKRFSCFKHYAAQTAATCFSARSPVQEQAQQSCHTMLPSEVASGSLHSTELYCTAESPPRQQKPAVHACSEDKHPHCMPPYTIIRAPPCDPVQRLANSAMSSYSNFEHPSLFRWDVQSCSFLTALEQAIANHSSLPLLLLLQLPVSLLGSFPLHVAFSTTPVSLHLWSLQGSLQLHHLLLHNAQAAVSYSSWFRSTAWSQLGEVIKPLTLSWALGRHGVPTPSQ